MKTRRQRKPFFICRTSQEQPPHECVCVGSVVCALLRAGALPLRVPPHPLPPVCPFLPPPGHYYCAWLLLISIVMLSPLSRMRPSCLVFFFFRSSSCASCAGRAVRKSISIPLSCGRRHTSNIATHSHNHTFTPQTSTRRHTHSQASQQVRTRTHTHNHGTRTAHPHLHPSPPISTHSYTHSYTHLHLSIQLHPSASPSPPIHPTPPMSIHPPTSAHSTPALSHPHPHTQPQTHTQQLPFAVHMCCACSRVRVFSSVRLWR